MKQSFMTKCFASCLGWKDRKQLPALPVSDLRNYFRQSGSSPAIFLLSGLFLLVGGCAGQNTEGALPLQELGESSTSSAVGMSNSPEAFEVVDCLLPGQVRRLGAQIVFMTQRRPVRATVEDCVIRGGEYVSYDRSDLKTSLKVWAKAAESGNPEAQYYVATLYERGVNGKPEYEKAMKWYRKAAEQDHRQAAMNLSRLYDQGKGVVQNSQEAFYWVTKASGLKNESLTNLINVTATQKIQTLRKTVGLREGEIQLLQKSLEAVRKEKVQLQAHLAQEQAEAKAEREKMTFLEEQSEKLEAALQVAQMQIPQRQLEIQHFQQQLQALEQELGQKSLEGEKVKDLEASQQILEQQLSQLQEGKERDRLLREQQEQVYQEVKQKLEQSRQQLAHQEAEMIELTQKIETLESLPNSQANLPPGEDLGLDGPRIQIIDPPVIATRGIKVEEGRREVYLPKNSIKSLTGRVLAPAGMWELRVNGMVIEPDKEGIFTYELPKLRTQERSVPVDIVAVDIQNKRAISRLNLLSDKSLMTSQDSIQLASHKPFGEYYALVIGNNHYQHWDPLENAIADAEAVGRVLETQYGFNVKFLKDASRSDMLKTLNELRKKLTERDNLLIYYAGHGFWEKNINRGYWIPVEADLEDNSDWILLPTVTDLLQLMSAKHILVVADSCFAGKLTRSGLAQLRPGLSDQARMDLLKTLAEKRVRTAMTSGGLRPVLDSGGGRHSIFTKAFLNVLEENAEILETERIFLAVRNRVMKTAQRLNTEQIPTYAPVHMAGHESLGDFIFVPTNQKISSPLQTGRSFAQK